MLKPTPLLRDLHGDSFASLSQRTQHDFAIALAETSSIGIEKAQEKASQLYARILPEGQCTSGHKFWDIVDPSNGKSIGQVWLKITPDGASAFLYDLFIDHPFRHQGFGRATMTVIESLAGKEGCSSIELHVFPENTAARRLYRGLGYKDTDSPNVLRKFFLPCPTLFP